MNQPDLAQLNNSEEIAVFNQVFDYIVSGDAVGEAKRFAMAILEIFAKNPGLKKNNPSLFAIYNNYLIAAKYVMLFDLDEQEIIQLLRENFDFVLKHPDYDLDRKIKYKIRSITDLEQRDLFKDKIREALLKCSTPFSKRKIIINGIEQEATVANGLKDYHVKVGIERADSLEINEYLVNNENIKLLSPEEKTKLKKIFTFFESLKTSSVESPMSEENFGAILPDGKLAIASEGKLEKIDENILKIYREVAFIDQGAAAPVKGKFKKDNISLTTGFTLSDLEAALQNYNPSSLEYRVLKEEINRLSKGGIKKSGSR